MGQTLKRISDRIGGRLSPEGACLGMGLICGLIFLFTTPPFQAPDEPQYFYRAFHLSEFRFFDLVYLNPEEKAKSGSVYYGVLLPRSLALIVDHNELTTTRFRPSSKVSPSNIIATLKITLNPDEREYLPIPGYPPIGYIPQAIGIALGRIAGLPPLALFYMGRLGALTVWLSMMYLSVRITPVLKWTYFLLSMMPMTLHLAASNSADSTVIGLCFVMSAMILRWAYDETKDTVGWSDIAYLSAIAIGIALSKPIYLALVFLVFLVPHRKFKNLKVYCLALAMVLTVAVAAQYVYGSLVVRTTSGGPTISLARHGVDVTPSQNVSPSRQVEFLRSHPVTFFTAVANTITRLPLYLFNSFFGLLGWLDTWLPQWVPFGYFVGLIMACRHSGSDQRVTWKAKLIGAAIFGATGLVSLLYIYIFWDSVGANYIGGFQGRYLIPVAPALALVFHKQNTGSNRAKTAAIAYTLFVALASAATTHSLIKRFY
jgi:uncharacterized membrane protein